MVEQHGEMKAAPGEYRCENDQILHRPFGSDVWREVEVRQQTVGEMWVIVPGFNLVSEDTVCLAHEGDASRFAEMLNAGNYGGRSDWRAISLLDAIGHAVDERSVWADCD